MCSAWLNLTGSAVSGSDGPCEGHRHTGSEVQLNHETSEVTYSSSHPGSQVFFAAPLTSESPGSVHS